MSSAAEFDPDELGPDEPLDSFVTATETGAELRARLLALPLDDPADWIEPHFSEVPVPGVGRKDQDLAEPDSRGDAADGDDTVMLAIRVPRRVRERAHLAARTSGAASTQEWLLRVVTDAVDIETTAGARQASLLWASIRENMQRQIDDGTYERVASSFPDPDLYGPDLGT